MYELLEIERSEGYNNVICADWLKISKALIKKNLKGSFFE